MTMTQKSKKPGSVRHYGWKRSLPDRRDYRFHVSHKVLQTLPPYADLTAGMGPVLDQSSEGSCGPNSIDSLVMFDQQKQGMPVSSISRQQAYYATRILMGTVDQDSGVDNRTMLKALNQYGFCDESLWPYDLTKMTTNPPQSVWNAAAVNKVSNYASVLQSLDQMKGCVVSGFPFLFGFTVYESFESDAAAQTGIIPMPLPSESVMGGHDICYCGFSDVQRPGNRPGNIWPAMTFRFKNSWSAGWGDGGYGYMPYSYATDPNMAGDFWVINAVPGGTPPGPGPGPNPPPPPPPGPIQFQPALMAAYAFGESHGNGVFRAELMISQGLALAWLAANQLSGSNYRQMARSMFWSLQSDAMQTGDWNAMIAHLVSSRSVDHYFAQHPNG